MKFAAKLLKSLLITAALAATFIAEIMGRSVFYDSMTRIGM